MGEIVPKPDKDSNRLRVRMSPEDLLRHPYLLSGEKAGEVKASGDTIADAIGRLAWKQVYLLAPHLIEKEWMKSGARFICGSSVAWSEIMPV